MEPVNEETDYRATGWLVREWSGILVPPIVWLVQFQTNYTIVPFLCGHGSRALLFAVTVVALAAIAGAGLLSWRVWRRSGAEWPGPGAEPEVRSRFMAALGVLSAGLFFLLALMQGVATAILTPCD